MSAAWISEAEPGEFPANNVAVYSPDRPHVIVHGKPQLSPWIDVADLDRRGAVFVWEQASTAPTLPEGLHARFPRVEALPPLVLPLQSRTTAPAGGHRLCDPAAAAVISCS